MLLQLVHLVGLLQQLACKHPGQLALIQAVRSMLPKEQDTHPHTAQHQSSLLCVLTFGSLPKPAGS